MIRRSSTESNKPALVGVKGGKQNGFLPGPSPSPSLTPMTNRNASHGHDVDMNRTASHGHDVDMNRTASHGHDVDMNRMSCDSFSIPMTPLRSIKGIRSSLDGVPSRELVLKEPTEPSATSLEMLLERQWTQSAHFVMDQASHYDVANLMSVLHQYRSENDRLEERLRNLTSRRDHLSTVNARLSLPLNGTFASTAFGSTSIVTSSSSGTLGPLSLGGGSSSLGLQHMPSGGGPGQPVPGLSLANFLPPHAPSLSGLINSANVALRASSSAQSQPTEPFTINGQRFPMVSSSGTVDGPSPTMPSMYTGGAAPAAGPFSGLMVAAAMAGVHAGGRGGGGGGSSSSASSSNASPSPFGSSSTTPLFWILIRYG